MESDLRYFRRRAAGELLAAKRAITPQAQARHMELAERYALLVSEKEQASRRGVMAEAVLS